MEDESSGWIRDADQVALPGHKDFVRLRLTPLLRPSGDPIQRGGQFILAKWGQKILASKLGTVFTDPQQSAAAIIDLIVLKVLADSIHQCSTLLIDLIWTSVRS